MTPRTGLTLVLVLDTSREHAVSSLESLAGAAPDAPVVAVGRGEEAAGAVAEAAGSRPGRVTAAHAGRSPSLARAVNKGADTARQEYDPEILVIVTVPVRFQESSAPAHLAAALGARAELGAVSPLVLHAHSKRVRHAGVGIGYAGVLHNLFEHYPPDHAAVSRPRVVQAMAMDALAVRARAFFEAGGLDTGYKHGFADADFCARLRRAGWKLGVDPGSRVLCAGGERTYSPRVGLDLERLLSRHREALVPDYDRILAAGGYQAGLTEWLQMRPVLPAAREAQLLEKVRGRGEFGLEVMDEEPCFAPGYEYPARVLEKEGDFEAAADVRQWHCFHCPGLAAWRDYVRCLEKAHQGSGDKETARRLKEAKGQLAGYEALARDSDRLGRQAMTCLEQAEKLGRTETAGLYRDWLRGA